MGDRRAALRRAATRLPAQDRGCDTAPDRLAGGLARGRRRPVEGSMLVPSFRRDPDWRSCWSEPWHSDRTTAWMRMRMRVWMRVWMRAGGERDLQARLR